MQTANAIQALSETNQNAKFYTLGATFNRECAAHVFAFSCMLNWKETLTKDPLALFYLYRELENEPLNIKDRSEKSKLLNFAMWQDVLEDDAYYPCLVTDIKGVIKMGYWYTYTEIQDCLEYKKLPAPPTTDYDASLLLIQHRKELFSKYFNAEDVEFILLNIPHTTTIK